MDKSVDARWSDYRAYEHTVWIRGWIGVGVFALLVYTGVFGWLAFGPDPATLPDEERIKSAYALIGAVFSVPLAAIFWGHGWLVWSIARWGRRSRWP